MRLVFVSVKSFETFTLVVYLRYDSKLRHGEDPTDKTEVLCALSLPSVLSSSRFLCCLPSTDGHADAAPRCFVCPRGRSLVWVVRYTPQIKKVHVPGLSHLCVRFSSARSPINRSWKNHLSGRLCCPGERFGLGRQPRCGEGSRKQWGLQEGVILRGETGVENHLGWFLFNDVPIQTAEFGHRT